MGYAAGAGRQEAWVVRRWEKDAAKAVEERAVEARALAEVDSVWAVWAVAGLVAGVPEASLVAVGPMAAVVKVTACLAVAVVAAVRRMAPLEGTEKAVRQEAALGAVAMAQEAAVKAPEAVARAPAVVAKEAAAVATVVAPAVEAGLRAVVAREVASRRSVRL